MGKVRTETIKRVAIELVEKYPDRFTNAFEENKKTTQELVAYDSKKLRNLIAGYVTRLKRIQEMRASLPMAVEEGDRPEQGDEKEEIEQ